MTETADIPSLNAFLNAALREGVLRSAHFTGATLCFALPDGRPASVVVGARSQFRSRFGSPVTIDGATVSIDALLGALTAKADPLFARRVSDSLATIRTTGDATGDPEFWTFREAEAALRFGHVLHPNPRSRDGISAEEAALYTPESGGRFALEWFAVDPAHHRAGGLADDGFRRLAEADGIAVPADRRIFPMHPFQVARTADNAAVAALIQAGKLDRLGLGQPDWSATASMRAVHAFHAPFMVKFSLSLRLTNSMRLLSQREVLRGLHVTDLLNSEIGREIAAAFPGLTILTEPAFAALQGADGDLLSETIAVLRDNPFQEPNTPGPIILAALCEAPREGLSPLGRIVTRLAKGGDTASVAKAWFAAFLTEAIRPVLELRARYGLLFCSHQQNMMLTLRNGWPGGAVIRDCQGTGHLAPFHQRLASVCPGIGEGSENVLDIEEGDRLITYYIVVNTVMNTLATLVLDGLVTEAALRSVWHRFLDQARRETPGDPTFYRRLLERPSLTAKANFATSLSGVNEADGGSAGQLASFLELTNPIVLTEAA
ncbi:hypothetical protein LQ948_06525 [Jiella sp. MQZ9-1]|uniref:Siderophore synthetase component n=1 Tax=Jiella flava TaxID=2816857 RepID=A0A939FVP6_9HYPH|nr:IucA/IucC family protein [Jiella flava]MBO0662310.1 hypothetical protein [Jiella flava]MCD2470859.1 hypothetical protein [Jiella flava]